MGMNVGFLLVNSCPTYISNFTLSRVGVAGNPPTTRYASPITLDAVMEPFVCTDKIEISNPRIDLDCQWKKPAISTQHTPYSVSGVGKQPHATPPRFHSLAIFALAKSDIRMYIYRSSWFVVAEEWVAGRLQKHRGSSPNGWIPSRTDSIHFPGVRFAFFGCGATRAVTRPGRSPRLLAMKPADRPPTGRPTPHRPTGAGQPSSPVCLLGGGGK